MITVIFLPRKTRRALQHWLTTFELIVALIQLAATPTATSRWQTESNLPRKRVITSNLLIQASCRD